jgi:hypothetical protein
MWNDYRKNAIYNSTKESVLRMEKLFVFQKINVFMGLWNNIQLLDIGF